MGLKSVQWVEIQLKQVLLVTLQHLLWEPCCQTSALIFSFAAEEEAFISSGLLLFSKRSGFSIIDRGGVTVTVC